MSKPNKRPVHVAEIKKTYKGKVHVSTYLRRTFRQDGKVKHETVANILRTLIVQAADAIPVSAIWVEFFAQSAAVNGIASKHCQEHCLVAATPIGDESQASAMVYRRLSAEFV